jgi:hypothetical protein
MTVILVIGAIPFVPALIAQLLPTLVIVFVSAELMRRKMTMAAAGSGGPTVTEALETVFLDSEKRVNASERDTSIEVPAEAPNASTMGSVGATATTTVPTSATSTPSTTLTTPDSNGMQAYIQRCYAPLVRSIQQSWSHMQPYMQRCYAPLARSIEQGSSYVQARIQRRYGTIQESWSQRRTTALVMVTAINVATVSTMISKWMNPETYLCTSSIVVVFTMSFHSVGGFFLILLLLSILGMLLIGLLACFKLAPSFYKDDTFLKLWYHQWYGNSGHGDGPEATRNDSENILASAVKKWMDEKVAKLDKEDARKLLESLTDSKTDMDTAKLIMESHRALFAFLPRSLKYDRSLVTWWDDATAKDVLKEAADADKDFAMQAVEINYLWFEYLRASLQKDLGDEVSSRYEADRTTRSDGPKGIKHDSFNLDWSNICSQFVFFEGHRDSN